MNGHDPDRRRARRHAGGQPARAERFQLPVGVGQVEVERDGIAVHEHGDRAEVPDDLGRRRERHRGHEDGVSGLQAERLDRQVKCGGTRVERDRVACPDGRREVLLEAPGPGSGREPSGLEGGDDLVDLAAAEVGSKEGNGVLLHAESSWRPGAGGTAAVLVHRLRKWNRPARKPKP